MNSDITICILRKFCGRRILSTLGGLALSLAFAVSALGQQAIGQAGERVDPLSAKADPRLAAAARESSAPSPLVVEVAGNYVFTTATNASLTDMSSGTTQLLAPNIDDTASPLTNIGFDFYFQGARFTQFGINDNGVLRLGATAQTSTPYKPLAQAGISIITAYGADQRTHTGDGKVHFKVIG